MSTPMDEIRTEHACADDAAVLAIMPDGSKHYSFGEIWRIGTAIRAHKHRGKLLKLITDIETVVSEQAEDEGLWFVAETAAEAYLQSAMRRLHEAVEGRSRTACALSAIHQAESGEKS